MITYNRGSIVHISIPFVDGSNTPHQITTGTATYIIKLGATTIASGTLVYNSDNQHYEVDYTIASDAVSGAYDIIASGNIGSGVQQWLDGYEVGFVYTTVAEIRNSYVGFDFTAYDDSTISSMSMVAQGLIDASLGMTFSGPERVETGKSVVTREGYMYLKVQQKPIVSINRAKVRVAGGPKIPLNIEYLDVHKEGGFMYYATSIAQGFTNSAYPSLILTQMDNFNYEISYQTRNEVPLLLKRAVAMVVANLLKAQWAMTHTGLPGNSFGEGGYSVAGFSSGKYSEQYRANKPSSNNALSKNSDAFLTPDVMALLKGLRSVGQNSFN